MTEVSTILIVMLIIITLLTLIMTIIHDNKLLKLQKQQDKIKEETEVLKSLVQKQNELLQLYNQIERHLYKIS